MDSFLNSCGIFVSHAWDYDDDYQGIVSLLDADITFKWRNLSVPRDRPLPPWSDVRPKSYRSIIRLLDDRVKEADCVLVLAGMYVAHAGWIQSEIDAAKEFQKPIIAIAPRGQERFPKALIDDADERVGWNSRSIIEAIRRRTSPQICGLFGEWARLAPSFLTPEIPAPPATPLATNLLASLQGRYRRTNPSPPTALFGTPSPLAYCSDGLTSLLSSMQQSSTLKDKLINQFLETSGESSPTPPPLRYIKPR